MDPESRMHTQPPPYTYTYTYPYHTHLGRRRELHIDEAGVVLARVPRVHRLDMAIGAAEVRDVGLHLRALLLVRQRIRVEALVEDDGARHRYHQLLPLLLFRPAPAPAAACVDGEARGLPHRLLVLRLLLRAGEYLLRVLLQPVLYWCGWGANGRTGK